jgi:hypothetical protein
LENHDHQLPPFCSTPARTAGGYYFNFKDSFYLKFNSVRNQTAATPKATTNQSSSYDKEYGE